MTEARGFSRFLYHFGPFSSLLMHLNTVRNRECRSLNQYYSTAEESLLRSSSLLSNTLFRRSGSEFVGL